MRKTAAVLGLLCLAAAAAFAGPAREAAAPESSARATPVAAPSAVSLSAPSLDLAPGVSAPSLEAAPSIEAAAAPSEAGAQAAATASVSAQPARGSASAAVAGSSFLSGESAARAVAAVRGVSAGRVFDGRRETADAVLARLEASSLTPFMAARAIAAAPNLAGAVSSLSKLGLVRPQGIPSAQAAHYLVARVWDATSPSILGRAFSFSPAKPISTIRVVNDDRVFLIHGIHHGEIFPSLPLAVRRLARAAAARGEQLFSEQRFPAFFGYRHGRELNDVAALNGAPPAALAPGALEPTWGRDNWASRALVSALLAAGGAVAIGLGVLFGPLGGLAASAAVAPAAWIILTGGRARERWTLLALALRSWARGEADFAAQTEREARALFRRRVEALDIMRLSLPPGVAGVDDVITRSEAMAQAIRRDAAAGVVHVLVGHEHAAHVAWRLAAPRAGRKS